MSQQYCLQSRHFLSCGSSFQTILAYLVVPFPQEAFPREKLVGNNERGTF